jgi:hypothetical protein
MHAGLKKPSDLRDTQARLHLSNEHTLHWSNYSLHNFPRGDAGVDPDLDAVSLIGLGLLGNRKGEKKTPSSLNRSKNRVSVRVTLPSSISTCQASVLTAAVAQVTHGQLPENAGSRKCYHNFQSHGLTHITFKNVHPGKLTVARLAKMGVFLEHSHA